MGRIARILLYVIAALYPVLMFVALAVLKLPVRFFSLFVIAIALFSFLSATGIRGAASGRGTAPAKKKRPASCFQAPCSWAPSALSAL
ncbi:MAG: hypothetical protein LBN21_00515 [Treponema sp.]|jgi:hypothetical protein|nr:hypothetical protein [Treponema sp.]